jgi:hypothetical protein
MTKASEFVRALKEARHGGTESVADARNRQKLDWLSDLEALRTSVRQWLAPVVDANLATISDKATPLAEPDLGEYVAVGLEISLAVAGEARTVLLRPRGARIAGVVAAGGARAIGAQGRVDIECGVAREILLRFKDGDGTRWISFSGGKKRTLDEDVFFELLAQVTELKPR